MRPLFIGGCGRSGTTMLGDLLGAHPEHVCLPETTFKSALLSTWRWRAGDADRLAAVRWLETQPKFRDLGLSLDSGDRERLARASFAQLMDELARRYAASVGKEAAKVWIDQTPQNTHLGVTLFEEWPEARMIHLVRDGRAVAASVIPLDWGPNNVVSAARWWIDSMCHGLALEAAYPERVLRVRYEDVVADAEKSLRRICAFAEIPFDPCMTRGGGLRLPPSTARQHKLVGRAPDPTRLDAWKSSLSQREVELFESEVGQLLELLGYTPVHGETARPLSPLASFAFDATHWLRNQTINRLRKRRRRAGRARRR